MSSEPQSALHPTEVTLPILSKLGSPTIPDDLDAASVAKHWFSTFTTAIINGNVDKVVDHLVQSDFTSTIFNSGKDVSDPDPSALSVYWRDLFALTWDARTFEGISKIKRFLKDRLLGAKPSNFELSKEVPLELQRPFPDLAWIQLVFTFETDVGLCTGVARLVPLGTHARVNSPPSPSDGVDWKAHTVFTNLDGLKGFPEQLGSLRNHKPNHGKWENERKAAATFEKEDPTVLIIGGGHSGLDVAARLKVLGVSSLIVDKNERIGDNWRTRYEALCLHDPVWYDHMPYLPFPPTWPVFSPAKKLAHWIEQYAEFMELNVWSNSEALSAKQDPQTKIWSVQVRQNLTGALRTFKVKNVVLAIGFKGGKPYMPTYPGMDTFKGTILHSHQHKKATDHAGKKVLVIGSCTSAHDICVDYADHGIDVTMFQRSSTYVMSTKNGIPILMKGSYEEGGPPTELADKISASIPNLLMTGIGHRAAHIIADLDKDTLDGLHKRGFRTNMGDKAAGLLISVWNKAGGYYMDVGGSQYIIDGKIKLKSDSQIKEFTDKGVKFENGSELETDVVVFCTGLSDPRTVFGSLIDRSETDGKPEIPRIWGLNEEGELYGCFKELDGFPGLWNIMGNLALSRFMSKHIALQIKAKEEGLFGERYTI